MGCKTRACEHVILVPAPVWGHCLPFFYLAGRLAHLGLRVTILVPEGFVSSIVSNSFYVAHLGEILRENVEVVAVQDGVSQQGGKEGFLALLRESSEPLLVAAFAESVGALMSSSSKSPAPCCVISDMLMGWTQTLAEKFNIPRYILHTQSAANLSLMLHVPTLLAEGRLPLTDSNQEKPVEIPGLKIPLRASELPSDLFPEALVQGAYDLFLRMSRRAGEAPIVLINTFRELEHDVFVTLDALHASGVTKMPKVIPVGPLLRSAPFSKPVNTADTPTEVDESTVRFLDSQARGSVVYIAFGTAGAALNKKNVEEVAHGVEASGQPFLWAEGPGGFTGKTLTQVLPPGFEERTKGTGMVVSGSVPQVRFLNHPATGAFLSHCGWNSVLESVAAGVPILTSPLRADQKMNARYLVDVAKVAAELKLLGSDQTYTRSEVERVVRLVMQQEGGQVLRSNLQSLKEAAAKNAASVETMQTFIELCGGQCDQGGCGVAMAEVQNPNDT